jgi:ferrous iron transport protein A
MQLRRKSISLTPNPCANLKEIPITCLQEGDKAVMTHTTGGLGIVRRLSEMGLTPGCEVRLLRKGSFHGPLEIEVRGVSLAVGYGLASKMMVQP